ncbi:MAG: DUF4956 domain-containing protein [Clostridia bacterium]|nr:DUF4956 domain-containing protein [Clostridia bacterium]
MLESVLTETVNTGITMGQFSLCTVTSVLLGAALAAVHTYGNRYSRSFILTLVLLPVMVQTVIMLVNGNLGTGVAVMGAFSLVRFRSMPGNAREIGSIFLAMALGLAAGMGYLGTALILMMVAGGVTILLVSLPSGRAERKELKITIPENLDYSGIFDDIFEKYTKNPVLVRVRTVNMGSLYELCYHVDLKSESIEKNMLDDIRCRNGNLTIVCGRLPDGREEL